MPTVTLWLEPGHGFPIRVYVHLTGPDGGEDLELDLTPQSGRTVRYKIPILLAPGQFVESVLAVTLGRAYWSVLLRAPIADHTVIPCEKVTFAGPTAWWHALHGVAAEESTAGEAIRIGIIDASFPPEGSDPGLAHVRYCGRIVDGALVKDDRGPQESHHGYTVTSLLCNRSEPGQTGFVGMASGAEAHFVSAGVRSDDQRIRLDVQSVARAIDLLAGVYGCDLINLSAGDLVDPQPAIVNACRRAARLGALVICAAGNQGGPPRFPASYDVLCAVAACGVRGVAPRQADVRMEQPPAGSDWNGDAYLAAYSARGPGVDLIAAGDGVISTIAGEIGVPLRGTSYAAPVATGVLARLLQKDSIFHKVRSTNAAVARVREVIRDHCDRGSWPAGAVGFGLIRW